MVVSFIGMTSAALFWLALLHAFSLATTSVAAWGRTEVDAAQIALGQQSAGWIETRPRASEESIRIPARVAAGIAQRTPGVVPVSRESGATFAKSGAPYRLVAAASRQPLLIHGMESHRLASRGHVLPYFPTAPPRQA